MPETLSIREYLETRFNDYITAHRREHELIEMALNKAELAMTVRLETMNDLRKQISEERGQYVHSIAFDTKHTALVERLNSIETNAANLQGRFWMMGVIFTAAGAGAALLINLAFKYSGH